MAVPFLPQNQLVYPANADLSQGIASLGETVANSIQQGRNRNALIKVSERIGSGDYQGAVAEAVKSGDPKVVQSVNSLIGAQGVHGTPIYGIDPATGQPVVGTLTKMGGFRRADTGGIIPQLPGGQYYGVGTGHVFANPRFPGVNLPPTTVPQSGGAPVQSGAQMQPGAQPRPQAMPSRGSMAPSYIPKDVVGESREKKLGTEQAELMAGKTKAQNTLNSLESQWSLVDNTIDRLLKEVDWSKSGLVGSLISAIPGTGAYDFSKDLETITANVGFDKLQDMRANSPTGGALGQVSDFENRLLQTVRGSMRQGLSPGRLRQNLLRIKRDLSQLRDYQRSAFKRTYGNVPSVSETVPTQQQPSMTKTIGDKTYIKIGNDWYEQ